MFTIKEIIDQLRLRNDIFEIELIIAHIIGKPREFVLAHPECPVNKDQRTIINKFVKRRKKNEPLAYILGHKEFFGLDFKVTPDTLIPRPETEHLVDAVISNLKLVNRSKTQNIIADIGTGSGNIIISIAKNLNNFCHSRENGNPVSNLKVSTLDSRLRGNDNCKFYATDLSGKALRIAKYNALKNKVNKKIKFIKSDLLDIFIQNTRYKIRNTNLIIVSNLPYLSKKIYDATAPDVKNFEPKSALLSGKDGLDHYEKLFQQIKEFLLIVDHCSLIIEFSPEQKPKINKLVRKYFPSVSPSFSRDLAGKWRVVSFDIA